MGRFLRRFGEAFRRGDLVLLFMCLALNIFGMLMIVSTTYQVGPLRYVIVQAIASALGVFMYVLISSIDSEFFSEHRYWLVVFNCLLLLLLIPFGTDGGTGNRSWLDFAFLPFYIQPAEICKIFYILIMASVMSSFQSRVSSVRSVFTMVLHLGLLAGLNVVLSEDLGVTLIFIFIFVGMAFSGGVNLIWFAAAIGGIAVLFPILWNFLDEYQQLRIEILFNPELDALGTGARYHTVLALRSLTGGGLTGQGLFQGHRTQTEGALFAQHTDYIFAAIGEELGFVGCTLVVLALLAIIIRIIWVGCRSQDYMRRLICFGCASALIFQVISNVGMCIGITPVIGLTLPFVSYGGSSIVTLYTMLGLVSGVFARPASTSQERYVKPPYMYRYKI
ncbi:MAG: FtsW/RodA/SpoVE family cell cycle protein [Oscillospiraceae bacterium]|nr:FtsW/RodA/SpoVE family cell cycle protein [Oscillospiraceae bacterium]